MSRLSEMIKELCPDGVEYRKLGEIAEIVRGNGLQKKDFVDSGVGCIHYGQIYTKFGAFADKTLTYVTPELAATLKKVSTGDLVVAITSENVEDVCKCVAWLGNDDIVTGGHAAIVKHEQNPKYLSYIFQTDEFFRQKRKYVIGTKVIEMSPKKLAEIVIPVPPLPIQNEIVKLLDNFTELTAELTAELQLRKKQYNFYRDSLLNFDQNDRDVEWKTIGMIGDVTKLAGFEFTKYVTYVETGKIIALRGLNVKGKLDLTDVKYLDGSDLTKLERSKLYKDDILFTYVGTVGQVALVDCDDKYYLAPNVARIRLDKEVVDPAYIRYFFQTEYFMRKQIEKYAKTSSMKNLTMENIRKFQVPIPPLEVQAKIVSILDRFDTLCNDLTQGLPAEIAARRKQYEYYRDKLLTFHRKGA